MVSVRGPLPPLSTADLHPVKDDKTGSEGLYWVVDYPWPLWDRDVSSAAHSHFWE